MSYRASMCLDPPQDFFTVQLSPLPLFAFLGKEENCSFIILDVDCHPFS